MDKNQTTTMDNENEKSENEKIAPPELIDFANTFSENFDKWPAGTYKSETGKYTLEYVVANPEIHDLDFRHARALCDVPDLRMQFNINDARSYHKDFAFYLVLWCWAAIETNYTSLIEADMLSLREYLKTKRSINEMLKGDFTILESNIGTEETVQRIELIIHFIEKYNEQHKK